MELQVLKTDLQRLIDTVYSAGLDEESEELKSITQKLFQIIDHQQQLIKDWEETGQEYMKALDLATKKLDQEIEKVQRLYQVLHDIRIVTTYKEVFEIIDQALKEIDLQKTSA